jgi:hypothetical protein
LYRFAFGTLACLLIDILKEPNLQRRAGDLNPVSIVTSVAPSAWA